MTRNRCRLVNINGFVDDVNDVKRQRNKRKKKYLFFLIKRNKPMTG
jgi:hypothetical protein